MSENNSRKRTPEDITQILSLAKLNEDDLLPVSQTIYFTSNNVNDNNLRLLELDKHLHGCLKEGQDLYIKGSDDDTAVICTKSRTYNVIETETSNSLLVAENLKSFKELENETDRAISSVGISGIFNTYLEVLPGKPHIKTLKAILETTAYRGPEYESGITDRKYTFQELLDTVQISEDELNDALVKMHCFTIGGVVRLLDFQYHFRVLSLMLNFIEENSWDLDKVDYEETRNELSTLVLPEILDAVFDYYAEETNCIDGLQLYQYNQSKVCKFFAMVLLSSAGKFNLEEFLPAWSESVPLGMTVTEDMLYGIAIIDRNSIPPVIRELKEEVLSDDIAERLKVLFEIKDKWMLQEISPYIERLTSTTFDVTALLAKHARVSTMQGVNGYSLAPAANGWVPIGVKLTLVIPVTGAVDYNIQVKECKAKDTESRNKVLLTDENACILKPKLFGAFQKLNEPAGITLAYAFFNAFKFPDIMDLLIECNVELCKGECSICPDPNQKLRPGRRRRDTTNDTLTDPIRIGKLLRVLLPKDLSNGEAIVKIQEEESICVSVKTFVVSTTFMISLLTSATIFSAYIYLKSRHSYHKH